MKCAKCGAELVARPVPGAKQFPRRLECPEHRLAAGEVTANSHEVPQRSPQLVGNYS